MATDFPTTLVPPDAAPGLDLFAAAWLERFTRCGGDLYAYDSGRLLSFVPMPGEGRREDRSEYENAQVEGRFRELADLLHAVPGGREALLAHLRRWPVAVHADGVSTFQS